MRLEQTDMDRHSQSNIQWHRLGIELSGQNILLTAQQSHQLGLQICFTILGLQSTVILD
jgi:hypothetical protein